MLVLPCSISSVGSAGSVSSAFSALSLDELSSGSAGGPLPIILSVLTASPIALDFSAHQDALQLAGNLFAGECESNTVVQDASVVASHNRMGNQRKL